MTARWAESVIETSAFVRHKACFQKFDVIFSLRLRNIFLPEKVFSPTKSKERVVSFLNKKEEKPFSCSFGKTSIWVVNFSSCFVGCNQDADPNQPPWWAPGSQLFLSFSFTVLQQYNSQLDLFGPWKMPEKLWEVPVHILKQIYGSISSLDINTDGTGKSKLCQF